MNAMMYFQTGSDDASAFPVKDLIAIDAASTAVSCYFGAQDDIVSNVALTVTAAQEENVVKAIVAEINKGPHSDGLHVIADDANSVYLHTGITACGTLTLDVSP